jgi:protein TonB
MAAATELALHIDADYGASELKENYQKYLLRGLVAASLLSFLGVGTYWSSMYATGKEEPRIILRILRTELTLPPSLTGSSPALAVAVAAPSAKPKVGIPVAVPDAEISPEATIPAQPDLSSIPAEVGTGSGTDIIIEEEAPPIFVEYEKGPVAIRKVTPAYPEIARRAGIEGTVHVKIWVDKEGKVRKAEIHKSDADIFNQPAIDAVTQWVFTPALMKNGPVSVWVVIPLKFQLQGN